MAADHVEDDVDATAAGPLLDRLGKVGPGVVDDEIGPEVSARRHLGGRAGDHYAGADGLGNLDGSGAHA